MTTSVEFRVLGAVDVERDGHSLGISGMRPKALLAFLLLRPNQTIAADRIIDAVWPDADPARSRNLLQVTVRTLRKVIEDDPSTPVVLCTRPPGYSMVVDLEHCDAFRVERTIAGARLAATADDPHLALRLYDEALGSWRGDTLAEFTYEPWALDTIRRFDELRIDAMTERWSLLLRSGAHGGLVPEIEALVRAHPLREPLWAMLAHAHFAQGHQSEALRTLDRARSVLRDELGVAPGSALVAMERAVLDQDPALTANDPTPPRLVTMHEAPPWNPLPESLDRVVGRDEVIAELGAAVSGSPPAHRLVTLVGPGGIGKTTVAIAVAQQLHGSGTRVAFVDASAVTSAELLAPTIAAALGEREHPGEHAADSLVRAFGTAPAVLVIDNLEQVADAATVIADLLVRAPSLRILATSRTALRLPTEREVVLPALHEVAGEPDAAVQLFLDRALRVRADLDAGEATEIAELCRSLDGLPLAIELAAQATRHLSVAELQAHLTAVTNLARVAGRSRRHETLRSTVDWSLQLMPNEATAILDELVVFADWFTLPDAEEVTGRSRPSLVEGLARLLEHGLVRHDSATASYRVLFTVRLARPEPDPRNRWCHARWCADHLSGRPHTDGNVRAAVRYALDRPDPAIARALTIGLRDLWIRAGAFTEAQSVLQSTLELQSAVPDPELSLAAGVLHAARDDFVGAIPYLEMALAGFDRGHDVARCADVYIALCDVAALQGRLDDAEGFADSALRSADEHARPDAMALVSYLRGWLAEERGDDEAAEEEFSLHLDEARANGASADELAYATVTLAELAVLQADGVRARSLLEQSSNLAQDEGFVQLSCYRNRVDAMMRAVDDVGDWERARAPLVRAIDAAAQLGRSLELSWCLDACGVFAWRAGDEDAARRSFATADALRLRVGAVPPRFERVMTAGARFATVGATSDARYARLVQSLRHRPLADAVAAAQRVLATTGQR